MSILKSPSRPSAVLTTNHSAMSLSVARAQEIIATFASSIKAAPTSGESFQDPTVARNRLQCYAFSCGFLVVHYRGSVKEGRISYKCVHHGKNPRPHRKAEKITASAVPLSEYKVAEGHNNNGQKLRQRQTLASLN